jgi:hypothetical protein
MSVALSSNSSSLSISSGPFLSAPAKGFFRGRDKQLTNQLSEFIHFIDASESDVSLDRLRKLSLCLFKVMNTPYIQYFKSRSYDLEPRVIEILRETFEDLHQFFSGKNGVAQISHEKLIREGFDLRALASNIEDFKKPQREEERGEDHLSGKNIRFMSGHKKRKYSEMGTEEAREFPAIVVTSPGGTKRGIKR